MRNDNSPVMTTATGDTADPGTNGAASPRTFFRVTRSRWLRLVCALIVPIMMLTACDLMSTTSEEDEPGAPLDLETLEAETESGTLRAQRADNSYAGLIDEGRAIGVAFLDEVGAEDGQNGEDEIVVHLYDGQEQLAVMIGDVDADGAATLASGELSDFEATVELTIEGDAVSGTATFPGEEPIPFTAEAATGDDVCGVYWAHGTDQDPDVRGDWVVLPDGRQWGCACLPPFTNPCCMLQQ